MGLAPLARSPNVHSNGRAARALFSRGKRLGQNSAARSPMDLAMGFRVAGWIGHRHRSGVARSRWRTQPGSEGGQHRKYLRFQ